MKSLATLIKLQKSRVDEQRIQVARLQDHVTMIEQKIAQLEIDKAREQVAAQNNLESTATYGAFLKSAVHKGRELEKELHTANAAVEVAREQLTLLFEEQKRFETLEASRIEAEEREERRRETIELDEIGGVAHERHKER